MKIEVKPLPDRLRKDIEEVLLTGDEQAGRIAACLLAVEHQLRLMVDASELGEGEFVIDFPEMHLVPRDTKLGRLIHLKCLDGELEGEYQFYEHETTSTKDYKLRVASGIPWTTDGGQVGRRCMMTSPADLEARREEGKKGPFIPIFYEITNRNEAGNVLELEAKRVDGPHPKR